jgi:16S rRNA (cytidine1402-2'-O)-methyltransferase
MKATPRARSAEQSTQPDSKPPSTSPAGTLYVVATPIGNLEDITLRALRILREVQLVAAEDTRRTGNLLRHYEINTPLLSLHAHNEGHRVGQVIGRLGRGESIALVSDAGTPGISDPGAVIVQAAREAGYRVDPIPGPSSVTAALSAAGLDAGRFVFAGFPPIRSKDRIKWFEWVSEESSLPVVCFEAPHRIRRTLEDAVKYFGERPIFIGRELTKTHEQWSRGTASSLAQELTEDRGEFVMIVGPTEAADFTPVERTDAEVAQLFGQMTNHDGLSRRDRLRSVAEQLRLPVKAVYRAIERHKNSIK